LKRSANLGLALIGCRLEAIPGACGQLNIHPRDAGNKFEIRSTKFETSSNVQKEE
jgi:hypothetical protein